MELRDYALHILTSPTLEQKLLPALDITDQHPGEAQLWRAPARAPELAFAPRRKRSRMPALGALTEPHFRAVSLHHFANHELMALELFAAALLAFPEMPTAFRRGLLHVLSEEQEHFRLYQARMKALAGLEFGTLPLNDHFWRIVDDLNTPLKFVSALALTFEGGNLDYALQYARAFRAVGDEASAELMEQVHRDELGHVRFGLHWLRKLKDPSQSDFDAWEQALTFPTSPARARGLVFDRASREQVGFEPEFIDRLEHYQPPPRAPRS